MPDFVNPFPGMKPGKEMNNEELARALRLDLAAEEEATHLYTAHANAISNKAVKESLLDIANEERVHAGEFQRMIEVVTGDEGKFMREGAEEVNSKLLRGGGNMAQEADIDCLAQMMVVNILEHEASGSAKVIDPVRASDPNIPCHCFEYEDEKYCWKPGYLGLLSGKKNPEQIATCKITLPAGGGAAQRFTQLKSAISEAHKNWEEENGGGLGSWWDEVAKSLAKHNVSF